MGAGVVKPDQHGFKIHIHTGNRSNQRMDRQSSADLKCEECTSKLSRRKISCKDCDRLFCSQCSIQTSQQCKKCSILLSGNFSRPQLKQWKPKDLKALLHKHDVNTSKCREKDDLIDLIFTYFGSNPNINRGQPQHDRNLDDLRNNLRQENLSQQSSQQNASQTNPDNRNGTQTAGVNQPTQQSQNQSTPGSQNQSPQPPQNQSTQPPQNQSNQGSGSGNQPGTEDIDADEISSARSEITRIKLEDIRSAEHIEQLSIKCLKRLLLNNFVDYKGCCERWELQERVKRLWNDDLKNKQKAEEQRKISDDPSIAPTNQSSSGDDDFCKICMDAAIDCVLLECGHMVTCTNCGKRLSECPICRQYVVRAVHIFKA